MKVITYGIFAEDAANRIFMENTIPQLVAYFGRSKDIAFQHEGNFTEFVRPNNGQDTRQRFVAAANIGFSNFGLDICFVGFDCDDSAFDDIWSEISERCEVEDVQNKVLVFIPVQAIEYWLWYIKVKKEDNLLEDTPAIEGENRKNMKRKVYEKSANRCGNKITNPIVKSLSKSFNIPWLRQCSISFDTFAIQFEKYLKAA